MYKPADVYWIWGLVGNQLDGLGQAGESLTLRPPVGELQAAL